MHEGPGVSISLVGGRNSSIGLIMTSNLSFHAVSCRRIPKLAQRVRSQTIEDGSADATIAPVAFQGISLFTDS
jgi:hypothetical protein